MKIKAKIHKHIRWNHIFLVSYTCLQVISPTSPDWFWLIDRYFKCYNVWSIDTRVKQYLLHEATLLRLLFQALLVGKKSQKQGYSVCHMDFTNQALKQLQLQDISLGVIENLSALIERRQKHVT